jgi:hypothetical protein
MLEQVLIGGVVLVEQNFHVALSFPVHPVGVTTLQAVCDTVRAGFAIATDEWTAVALLTEQLRNADHLSPASDDVVLDPRKRQRWIPADVLHLVNLTFLCGHP